MSRWVVALVALALAACSPSGSEGRPTTSHTAERGEPHGVVRIEDGVFDWADEHETFSNESIVVTGSASRDELIEALERVAVRFMRVDETGVEHGPEVEEAAPLGPDGQELYTPNYVSTPTETPSGVHMYCKGVIDPRMRTRFLQILEEELGALGGEVTVAVAA